MHRHRIIEKHPRHPDLVGGCGALLTLVLALTVSTTGYAADPGFQSKAEKFVTRAEQYATREAEKSVQTEDDIEITGIVMDRTKTPTGRRFYQEFTADWIENLAGDIATANLVIEERPARSSSSLLTIRDDQQDVLFSTVLTPRIVGIRETAEAAAQTVRQRLVMKTIARSNEAQSTDSDLVGEGY